MQAPTIAREDTELTTPSLRIAIWQCISSETPYGVDVQVLPEDEKYPEIRKLIETKQCAGIFDGKGRGY
jgi:hypothetical protein